MTQTQSVSPGPAKTNIKPRMKDRAALVFDMSPDHAQELREKGIPIRSLTESIMALEASMPDHVQTNALRSAYLNDRVISNLQISAADLLAAPDLSDALMPEDPSPQTPQPIGPSLVQPPVRKVSDLLGPEGPGTSTLRSHPATPECLPRRTSHSQMFPPPPRSATSFVAVPKTPVGTREEPEELKLDDILEAPDHPTDTPTVTVPQTITQAANPIPIHSLSPASMQMPANDTSFAPAKAAVVATTIGTAAAAVVAASKFSAGLPQYAAFQAPPPSAFESITSRISGFDFAGTLSNVMDSIKHFAQYAMVALKVVSILASPAATTTNTPVQPLPAYSFPAPQTVSTHIQVQEVRTASVEVRAHTAPTHQSNHRHSMSAHRISDSSATTNPSSDMVSDGFNLNSGFDYNHPTTCVYNRHTRIVDDF